MLRPFFLHITTAPHMIQWILLPRERQLNSVVSAQSPWTATKARASYRFAITCPKNMLLFNGLTLVSTATVHMYRFIPTFPIPQPTIKKPVPKLIPTAPTGCTKHWPLSSSHAITSLSMRSMNTATVVRALACNGLIRSMLRQNSLKMMSWPTF